MSTIITDSSIVDTNASRSYSKLVPLRETPEAEDGDDGRRVTMVHSLWSNLDDLVRGYNRQVEENIRMLAGQQWSVYHPVLGKYLDVTAWMDAEERKWRQRPVFNRLLPWYIITHARATENPPIITFVPGPDRIDAELAEIMDIAQKSLWHETGMGDAHDRLMAWIIAAGRGHLQTRIDVTRGPVREWIGEDFVPVVDMNDQPVFGEDGDPIHQLSRGVPFNADGVPQARWRQLGAGAGELVRTGDAHSAPEGVLKVDVLSPLQVRGQWGPQPWHEKKIHLVRSYHTPEEIYDWFGVEVAPDVRGGSVNDAGELERILYGTGFYGAMDSRADADVSTQSTDGYVEVTQLWKAPCAYGGMEETAESTGGRYTAVTRTTCLTDGVRPARFPYTSPIRTFEFVRLPGRPGGTTPQEAMNPVQQAYNEGYARIKEHVNLCTNPKGVIDAGSGIKAKQFTNRPGDNFLVTRRPGVPAIEYIAPPSLGQDVYVLQKMLLQELTDMGHLSGTEGEMPSPDASGELVKELRFNSDRFLGPTMRRAVEEYGRMIEDWQAVLPIIWDEEKLLSYAGDDNVARTIVVMPHVFEQGKVNIRPDVESMLPEGRGERQARVYKLYMDGLFGAPGSPQALTRFYELAHMPHLSRVAKPGGIDRTTAEQENGKLVQGTDPRAIPAFEWYDDDVHLMVHEQFMKAPEFLKMPEQVQNAFVFHRQAHLMNRAKKMAAVVAQQAATQAALAERAGHAKPHRSGGNEDHSIAPGLPTPPTGGAPGGSMPTVAAPPSAI